MPQWVEINFDEGGHSFSFTVQICRVNLHPLQGIPAIRGFMGERNIREY